MADERHENMPLAASGGQALVPAKQLPNFDELFQGKLRIFSTSVLAIASTFPILMGQLLLIGQWSSRRAGRITDQLKAMSEAELESGSALSQFTRLKTRVRQSSESVTMFHRLPRVFLAGLVTEYDILASGVFELLLQMRPELLNASKHTPDFSEISKLSSIEDIRKIVLDREVDDFSRSSRVDQINRLVKASGVNLLDYLPMMPEFVEITERRNLLVHTDGVVNEQYLDRCKSAGMALSSDVVLGTRLATPTEYLQRASHVMLMAGITIGHLLWRKSGKQALELAETDLNEFGYQLLLDRRYSLACDVLELGCKKIKKHSNENSRRVMVANLANALRLSKKKKEAIALFDAEDWSSCAIEFRLAGRAIREDHPGIAEVMKEIGAKNANVGKHAYHEWPLFRGFRETDEFKDAYRSVFGEDYVALAALSEEADKLDEFFDRYTENLRELVNDLRKASDADDTGDQDAMN